MYKEKQIFDLVMKARLCKSYNEFVEKSTCKTKQDLEEILKERYLDDLLVTIAETEEIGVIEKGKYRKLCNMESFYYSVI